MKRLPKPAPILKADNDSHDSRTIVQWALEMKTQPSWIRSQSTGSAVL